ncbi:MAG: hypothetical protein KME31_13675 [Tolypothrix carrinoi HA7290-LM1]|nr:hypothetical protein [Tolypothrix carrinoi HA7290-LM1]
MDGFPGLKQVAFKSQGSRVFLTPLPTPHSPFPIPHSPFPIPHSPFPIPHYANPSPSSQSSY